jgi:hypothetical protein
MSLAAPATKDGFAYAGDFYAEASGHNRHRRATVAELKSHFAGSGDAKDHPAHWYEAQLIHYGLKPSKTKGTAKMRLFEATTQGILSVPPHISKIEADLKKEWNKSERVAKQALKQQSSAQAQAPVKSVKRKAEEPINEHRLKSMTVRPDGSVDIQFTSSAKKTKPAKETPSKPDKKAEAAASAKTGSNKAPPAAKTSTLLKLKDTGDSKPVSKAKQTARRGGKAPAGSARANSSAADPFPALEIGRTKQTARRSRPFVPPASRPGPVTASSSSGNGYGGGFYAEADHPDEPPPPYQAVDEYESHYSDDHKDYSPGPASPRPELHPPLGLLNGRYDLQCTPDWGGDAGLILTLSGSSLWGSFDISNQLNGIFHLAERPYQSSSSRLEFFWRADRESGNGWISFVGGGRVEGCIGCQCDVDFVGWRVHGQGTRSEISAASMERMWRNYE